MNLIVGLGNPGETYANNRHNVGFRCINHFAKIHRIPLDQRQCRAQFGVGEVAGTKIVLAKPRTFMNLSGKSVGLLVERFQGSPSGILVIHDDLDLPLGKIRLQPKGSSAGHKGVESIIACLGSQDFPRVRVGIGHPQENNQDVVTYVLSDFSPEEKVVIETAIARVGEAILCLLTEGITIAMNRYN
jgi:peptidyl-tRNA hydrolase, PTH1 family